MRFACVLVAGLTISTLTAAAAAGPRLIAPDDPAGAEVRAAAKAFYLALAAGDEKAARGMFAGPKEQEELLGAMLKFTGAADRLDRALAARFGQDESRPKFSATMVALAAVSERQWVVINDDAAALSEAADFDAALRLQRVGRRWVVASLTPRSERIPEKVLYYRSVLAGMQASADGVETGRLAREADAAIALDAPLREFLRARPHPGGDPSPDLAEPGQGPHVAPHSFRALLGKQVGDRACSDLIATLPGLPLLRTAALPGGEPAGLFVVSRETGIALSFSFDARGLHHVTLHGAPALGSKRYAGELPEGLEFGERRRDVEARLGRPPESSGDGKHFKGDYRRLGVSVRYVGGGPRDPDAGVVEVSLRPAELVAPEAGKGPLKRGRIAFRLTAAEGEAGDFDLVDDPAAGAGGRLRLRREVLFDESALSHAGPDFDPERGLVVGLQFTPAAAERLAKVTGANLGRRMAVVLDGTVIMAPAIKSEMEDRVLIAFSAEQETETALLARRLHAVVYALRGDE